MRRGLCRVAHVRPPNPISRHVHPNNTTPILPIYLPFSTWPTPRSNLNVAVQGEEGTHIFGLCCVETWNLVLLKSVAFLLPARIPMHKEKAPCLTAKARWLSWMQRLNHTSGLLRGLNFSFSHNALELLRWQCETGRHMIWVTAITSTGIWPSINITSSMGKFQTNGERWQAAFRVHQPAISIW